MLNSFLDGPQADAAHTHEMICWYFCGMASEEELLAHLSKLKKLDDRKKPVL